MTGQLGPEPSIWLGTLQLNYVDSTGVSWTVEGLDGWYGSPTSTLNVVQRGAADGGWGGSAWLTPKLITMTVTLAGATAALLTAALDTLMSAATLTTTPLRVLERGGSDRTMQVRRGGEVLSTWQGSMGTSVTVSVPLIAEDPRKYSTTAYTGTCHLPSISGGLTAPLTAPITVNATVSSGQIPMSNAGSAACSPLLRIVGPVQQPVVTLQRADGSVQQLAYGGSLIAGDYLDLDCGAHTAILDGTASRRGLVSGAWPTIPPNGSALLTFGAGAYDSSATLSATWYDTWM